MVQDTVIPARYNARENKEYALFTKNQWRFPEWARERATRDYQGRSIQQDGYWSKDLEYRSGPYLRGPADGVMLRHYGASDICWSFGDAVCVTAPGNCRLHPQTTVPALLQGSPMTLSPRLMPATSMAFALMAGMGIQ